MTITKKAEGGQLAFTIEGRLDTITAPQLEAEIKASVTASVTKLVLDMAQLVYVSSAGLRVILSAQKIMNKQGEMILKHVSEEVMEVFEMTGFTDILTFSED